MRTVLDMDCPVEFGTLPDCDCPYEHWHVSTGFCLDIHHEEDGSIHITLSGDDIENETIRHGMTLEEARVAAFAWVAPLLGEKYP